MTLPTPHGNSRPSTDCGGKFTPGPWIADEFCEENDQMTRVGTYDGTPTYYHRTATIALCQTNHEDDEPDSVPKIGIVAAEANARLISAAPDLLEALQELADRQSQHPAHIRALAAISKALGESTHD